MDGHWTYWCHLPKEGKQRHKNECSLSLGQSVVMDNDLTCKMLS